MKRATEKQFTDSVYLISMREAVRLVWEFWTMPTHIYWMKLGVKICEFCPFSSDFSIIIAHPAWNQPWRCVHVDKRLGVDYPPTMPHLRSTIQRVCSGITVVGSPTSGPWRLRLTRIAFLALAAYSDTPKSHSCDNYSQLDSHSRCKFIDLSEDEST